MSTRRLRVIKYRGSGFGSNEYLFVIEPPGITLLPISDIGLSHQALGERISTGLTELGELMVRINLDSNAAVLDNRIDFYPGQPTIEQMNKYEKGSQRDGCFLVEL
jgi:hypothetical protein